MMNSSTTRILLSLIAVFLSIGLTLARSIEASDPESLQRNQVQLVSDYLPMNNAMLKYLLAREMVNRQRTYDHDESETKRDYWKQCAFNAVSCFGKK